MVKPRIIETVDESQEEQVFEEFNQLIRYLKEKGWMETDLIIKEGINQGSNLEIGSGPGYQGLEWLKKTTNTTLTGLEISSKMINLATQNAQTYQLKHRINYIKADAQKIPFKDNTFDGVFTNRSLHEWQNPKIIFNEIYRVLKAQGKYLISDLRRDLNPIVKWIMKHYTKPKKMQPWLISSINASYTKKEIQNMLQKTNLKQATVKNKTMGLTISGQKTKKKINSNYL